jgi:hypothetical protein
MLLRGKFRLINDHPFRKEVVSVAIADVYHRLHGQANELFSFRKGGDDL